jgi:hypothetical protein
MGLNSITKFTAELCERAGIEKPKHGKHSNQGGRRFAISKMASKGVSAAENMGMARHRNASVNVVYQDPNGDDRLSRLQAFRVEQQMLATFGSNNGVNTGHTIMAQQQVQVQQQAAAAAPAAQQMQAPPAPQVPYMQFAQPQYQQPQPMLQQLQPVMQTNTMMNHPQMMVPYQQIPQQGNLVDQALQQLLQLLQSNAAAQGQPQQGQQQQGHYQGGHNGGPI